MLYEIRERFEKLSIVVGRVFGNIPLTPNQWTILSLLPALVSAYCLAQSDFVTAAALFVVAAFMDLIDGSVARVTGRVSKFGAYLDTIVDRYVEALVVLALLFVAIPPLFGVDAKIWLFVYFFGAMMTTYAKAAAKEKELAGEEIKGGLLERAERLILLFIGILAATVNITYLGYVVVLLAVLANVSAGQRIFKARSLSK